tara:strand:- start:341 stop:739 length:399 start_codon:yes stop_codon:yes gene_type:complete
MIKSEKFSISKRHYAYLKGSLEERKDPYDPKRDTAKYSYYTLQVFYYKKKNGLIEACFGTIWNYAPQGLSEKDFVAQYSSAYGSDPYAQWGGTHFLGTSVYKDIVRYVKELDPVLKKYPAIPEGYVGWFKKK